MPHATPAEPDLNDEEKRLYAPSAPDQSFVGAKGTVAWAMGFLAYIPIPFVGSIITGIVMSLVGYAQRDKGALARENGRHAANWGLTYLLMTVVLIGGAVVTLAISTGGGGRVPDPITPIVFTMIGIWAFPLQITHLVLTITGVVKASKGAVFANKLALPLLR